MDYVLGGIAAVHDELKIMNKWLHRLYNVDMFTLSQEQPEAFERLNFVHNTLNMFMEDDWERFT